MRVRLLLCHVFLIYILLNISVESGSAGNSPGCDTCKPEYVDKCSNGQYGVYFNISYCCCNNKILCFLPTYTKNHTVQGGPDSGGAISFVITDKSESTSIMISYSNTPSDMDPRTWKRNLRNILVTECYASPSEPYNKTIDGKPGMIMEGEDISGKMAFAAIYYPTPKKQVSIKTRLNKDHFNKFIETLMVRDQACD